MTDPNARALSDIAAFMGQGRPDATKPPAPRDLPIRWYVSYRAGGTYTPGTSWDAQFAVDGTTYRQRLIESPDGGAVFLAAAGLGFQAVALLDVNEGEYDAYLMFSAGACQIEANGYLQDVAASGLVTVPLRSGENVVAVRGSDTAANVMLIVQFKEPQI